MIVNKVTTSGLMLIDLSEYYPQQIKLLDLKQFLFKELILKEENFRQALKQYEWHPYTNEMTAIYCSANAIIPYWAYMLPLVYLSPIGAHCFAGNIEQATQHFFIQKIQHIDTAPFKDKRVIIKGCSDTSISAVAYTAISEILLPVVKSLMYGEACSNVPIYKSTTL